jgi:hypothetical protein
MTLNHATQHPTSTNGSPYAAAVKKLRPTKSADKFIPEMMVFNVQVVFSPEGALVAKYYKHALMSEMGNTQPTPDLIKHFKTSGIFTASFTGSRNVKFGLLI